MKEVNVSFLQKKPLSLHHSKRERAVYFDSEHYYKIWVQGWEHSRVARHGFECGYYDDSIASAFEAFIVEDVFDVGYAMKKGTVIGGSRDPWTRLINAATLNERKAFIRTVFEKSMKNRM